MLTAARIFLGQHWKAILELIAVLVIFAVQAYFFYSKGIEHERANWNEGLGTLIKDVNTNLKKLGDDSTKLGDSITDTQALVSASVGEILAGVKKGGGLKPLTVEDCNRNMVGEDFVKAWNALNKAGGVSK